MIEKKIQFAVPENWTPLYSRWRHGGWYVDNVCFPQGHVGCVSRNYPDRKWRIVCDDRRSELGVAGDIIFTSRDMAARAEYEIAAAEHDRLSLDTVVDFKHPYSDYSLKEAIALAVSTVQLGGGAPPTNLHDVRKIIGDALRRAGHTWLTGMVAMDLLDAVIDNRDLKNNSRLV